MDFIRAQLTKIPRVIPVDLSRSTVLITGANSGLGLEAAREILISKPERLILAVRDVVKGDEARKLLAGANLSGAKIDVRKLDQSSFKSIQDFVAQLKGERVDIAILNAGSSPYVLALTWLLILTLVRRVEYKARHHKRWL
jgi:retinol dehydrogenase-12